MDRGVAILSVTLVALLLASILAANPAPHPLDQDPLTSANINTCLVNRFEHHNGRGCIVLDALGGSKVTRILLRVQLDESSTHCGPYCIRGRYYRPVGAEAYWSDGQCVASLKSDVRPIYGAYLRRQ